jgi:AbiU2
MICIVGIDHEVQYLDSSSTSFLKSIQEWAITYDIKIIAEELSQEAIDKEGQARNQPLESTARHAASLLGRQHRLCDPNTSQRANLGIPERSEIAKLLHLRRGENEQLIEEESQRYWPVREGFWLDQIRDVLGENLLFICGSSHVESFKALLDKTHGKVVILHRHWNVESKLDDILSEGVVRDVYEAEFAKQLATFFGNNAEMLNSEYPHLFADLQRILTVWIFLAVARVFEEKNPRSPYPIRSIPEALKILEGGNVLVKDRSRAISALNVDESEMKRLAVTSETDFLKSVCQYFRTWLDTLSDSIKNVKEKRDKVIAHREAIDELGVARPKWGELEDLIALAKCFYKVVGEGVIGRPIDSDPGVLTRSFKRLLTQAGVKVS